MPFPKLARRLLLAAAVTLAFSTLSRTAAAQNSLVLKTYKVQVQYWFFDTDYYYWSTVFETTDLADAEFVYQLLLAAHENGQLNEVAPNSYWRYMAVDVRMITEYHYPQFAKPWYEDLTPLRQDALTIGR